eukprot:2850029-Alexandrium_andersonii.AAC.1
MWHASTLQAIARSAPQYNTPLRTKLQSLCCTKLHCTVLRHTTLDTTRMQSYMHGGMLARARAHT